MGCYSLSQPFNPLSKLAGCPVGCPVGTFAVPYLSPVFPVKRGLPFVGGVFSFGGKGQSVKNGGTPKNREKR